MTCGRVYPFKQLQSGHFVSGRTNSVLFDERGVNIQCYGCNVMKHGATDLYWIWMEGHYGREVIDELIAQRNTTTKFKVWDYQAIEEKYKLMTKEII